MKTNMKTLKDLFLDELADMYDAERRTVKALPKMAKAATCDKAEEGDSGHLKETEGHVTKLEQVFQFFDESQRENVRSHRGTAGRGRRNRVGLQRVAGHQRGVDLGRAEGRTS
jgi:ferritin-like metal-binding protein YciE